MVGEQSSLLWSYCAWKHVHLKIKLVNVALQNVATWSPHNDRSWLLQGQWRTSLQIQQIG